MMEDADKGHQSNQVSGITILLYRRHNQAEDQKLRTLLPSTFHVILAFSILQQVRYLIELILLYRLHHDMMTIVIAHFVNG